MDIQPKLGGVKLIGFFKCCLRDNGLKFGRSIQCNPTNDTMIELFYILKHLKLTLF